MVICPSQVTNWNQLYTQRDFLAHNIPGKHFSAEAKVSKLCWLQIHVFQNSSPLGWVPKSPEFKKDSGTSHCNNFFNTNQSSLWLPEKSCFPVDMQSMSCCFHLALTDISCSSDHCAAATKVVRACVNALSKAPSCSFSFGPNANLYLYSKTKVCSLLEEKGRQNQRYPMQIWRGLR